MESPSILVSKMACFCDAGKCSNSTVKSRFEGNTSSAVGCWSSVISSSESQTPNYSPARCCRKSHVAYAVLAGFLEPNLPPHRASFVTCVRKIAEAFAKFCPKHLDKPSCPHFVRAATRVSAKAQNHLEQPCNLIRSGNSFGYNH